MRDTPLPVPSPWPRLLMPHLLSFRFRCWEAESFINSRAKKSPLISSSKVIDLNRQIERRETTRPRTRRETSQELKLSVFTLGWTLKTALLSGRQKLNLTHRTLAPYVFPSIVLLFFASRSTAATAPGPNAKSRPSGALHTQCFFWLVLSRAQK